MKIFPEKRYATVSFPKENANYTVHEVFDRIMRENPHFTIRGAAVRLEPFNCRSVVFGFIIVNHKRPSYDRSRYDSRNYGPVYK